MIGKIVLTVLLIVTGLLVSGCAFFTDSDETDNNIPSPGDAANGSNGGGNDTDEGKPGVGDHEPPDLDNQKDPLAYFGLSMAEIKSILGTPDSQGFAEGAEYFFYPEQGLALFFWPVSGEENLVRSIQLNQGAEVAGIRVGMTFDEIKGVLGTPVFEGRSDYDGTYALVCDFDQFRLFFSAGTEGGPTTDVRIKYLQDS